MAAPSSTYNVEGTGGLASQALALSANVTFNIDVSTKFEGQLGCKLTTGGTVQASKGLQIDIYPLALTGTYATIAEQSYVMPNTAITSTYYLVMKVGTGKYQVKFTNLDTANAITVSGTLNSVDAIA